MPRFLLVVAVLVIAVSPARAQQPPSAPALDFDYF